MSTIQIYSAVSSTLLLLLYHSHVVAKWDLWIFVYSCKSKILVSWQSCSWIIMFYLSQFPMLVYFFSPLQECRSKISVSLASGRASQDPHQPYCECNKNVHACKILLYIDAKTNFSFPNEPPAHIKRKCSRMPKPCAMSLLGACLLPNTFRVRISELKVSHLCMMWLINFNSY